MSPWNKGKIVGQKIPFSPQHVRVLKGLLQSRGETMELTLFSMGIDTMLRAGDLLGLIVEDVIDHEGQIKNTITLKQQKTKDKHIVAISGETKEYLKKLILDHKTYEDEFLFTGQDPNKPITVRWYRYLVKKWVKLLGLKPIFFSTHSIRRTRAALIYKKTGNIEAVKILLGHKSVVTTSCYLDVQRQQALDIGKEFFV